MIELGVRYIARALSFMGGICGRHGVLGQRSEEWGVNKEVGVEVFDTFRSGKEEMF